jgi:hypothetical protein
MWLAFATRISAERIILVATAASAVHCPAPASKPLGQPPSALGKQ